MGHATITFPSEIGGNYSIEGGGDLNSLIEVDDFTATSEDATPLFIVRTGGRLSIILSGESDPLAGAGNGDTIIAFVPVDGDTAGPE